MRHSIRSHEQHKKHPVAGIQHEYGTDVPGIRAPAFDGDDDPIGIGGPDEGPWSWLASSVKRLMAASLSSGLIWSGPSRKRQLNQIGATSPAILRKIFYALSCQCRSRQLALTMRGEPAQDARIGNPGEDHSSGLVLSHRARLRAPASMSPGAAVRERRTRIVTRSEPKCRAQARRMTSA